MHFKTTQHDRSDALTLVHHRHAQNRSMPLLLEPFPCERESVAFGREHVVNVNRYLIDDRTAGNPIAVDRQFLIFQRYRTVMSVESQTVAIFQNHDSIIGSTKLAGAFDDGLQD